MSWVAKPFLLLIYGAVDDDKITPSLNTLLKETVDSEMSESGGSLGEAVLSKAKKSLTRGQVLKERWCRWCVWAVQPPFWLGQFTSLSPNIDPLIRAKSPLLSPWLL